MVKCQPGCRRSCQGAGGRASEEFPAGVRRRGAQPHRLRAQIPPPQSGGTRADHRAETCRFPRSLRRVRATSRLRHQWWLPGAARMTSRPATGSRLLRLTSRASRAGLAPAVSAVRVEQYQIAYRGGDLVTAPVTGRLDCRAPTAGLSAPCRVTPRPADWVWLVVLGVGGALLGYSKAAAGSVGRGWTAPSTRRCATRRLPALLPGRARHGAIPTWTSRWVPGAFTGGLMYVLSRAVSGCPTRPADTATSATALVWACAWWPRWSVSDGWWGAADFAGASSLAGCAARWSVHRLVPAGADFRDQLGPARCGARRRRTRLLCEGPAVGGRGANRSRRGRSSTRSCSSARSSC